MTGSVFYTLAMGFSVGIFFRSFCTIDTFYIFVLGVVGVVVLFFWRHTGHKHALLVALFFIAVSLGVLRYDFSAQEERDAVFDIHIEEKVVIEGVIIREIDKRANTTHLTVRAEQLDGNSVDSNVLVYAPRFPEFFYGDRVRAEGTLTEPDVFITDLGRTFNYPGYLSARGVTYVMSFANVEKISADEGNIFLAQLLKLKQTFIESVERVLPEPQAGLAEGLVLGVKRALGEDLEDAFRATGIIHIVVLSGYNITIVAEAIMRLLSFFFLPRTRVVFGIVAIASFALIAGLSATVLRASLMAGLVLVARATGRIYDVTRGLVLAGLIMLLINPKLLAFDPGFQLSFLATFGLIILAPLIEKRLSLVPTRFQIREFLTATLATQIFILPLLLYSIGEFSVVAILVNVLVLPAVPFAMLLIFISGAIGVVSVTLAMPFGFVAHLSLTYIIKTVELFASLPFASFPVKAFPFYIVPLSYICIAIGLVYVYRYTKYTISTGRTDGV